MKKLVFQLRDVATGTASRAIIGMHENGFLGALQHAQEIIRLHCIGTIT